MKKKWKSNLVFALVLAFTLCWPSYSAVYAADEFVSEEETASQSNAAAPAGIPEATGTDSVGDMLADALNDESQQNASASAAEYSLTGLTVSGTTATVELKA